MRETRSPVLFLVGVGVVLAVSLSAVGPDMFAWLRAWLLADPGQAARRTRVVLWAPGLVPVLVLCGWGAVRRVLHRFEGDD